MKKFNYVVTISVEGEEECIRDIYVNYTSAKKGFNNICKAVKKELMALNSDHFMIAFIELREQLLDDHGECSYSKLLDCKSVCNKENKQ